MQAYDSVLDLIGNTPLVLLQSVTAGIDATVLAKVESFNPGGSSKDRIALGMVRAARASGSLRPGGTIVEPTSGNTGVGLAIVAQRFGYRCIFTCPDKVSADKIALLRAYGAEVVICPATVPASDPRFYRNTARRLADELPGAVCLDQYANRANPAAHYASTGPELWRQTDGRITHFVAGIGTGGTISGTGGYLKEVSGGSVRVIGADPDGSVYTSPHALRPYLLEGVGQPSLPGCYDASVVDEIIAIADAEAIGMTRRLANEEGLLTGGSGGMTICALLRLAEQLKPTDVVVVLLPDSGRGYLSKLFNDEWLIGMGLADSPDHGPRVGELLCRGFGNADLPVLAPATTIRCALAALQSERQPYLLIGSARLPARTAEVAGAIGGPALALAVAADPAVLDQPVGERLVPLPRIGAGQSIGEACQVLAGGPDAAIVLADGLVVGLLTSAELLAGLAAISVRSEPPEPDTSGFFALAHPRPPTLIGDGRISLIGSPGSISSPSSEA